MAASWLSAAKKIWRHPADMKTKGTVGMKGLWRNLRKYQLPESVMACHQQ